MTRHRNADDSLVNIDQIRHIDEVFLPTKSHCGCQKKIRGVSSLNIAINLGDGSTRYAKGKEVSILLTSR